MPPCPRPSLRLSARPAATHSPFTNFQRQLSAGTKSSRKEYMELGSRPETLTFRTGNMRLKRDTQEIFTEIKCGAQINMHVFVHKLHKQFYICPFEFNLSLTTKYMLIKTWRNLLRVLTHGSGAPHGSAVSSV